mgnify:CR=1 FL=1
MPAITILQPIAMVADRLMASAVPLTSFKAGITVAPLPTVGSAHRFRLARRTIYRGSETDTAILHVELTPLDANTTCLSWGFRPTLITGLFAVQGMIAIYACYMGVFGIGRGWVEFIMGIVVIAALLGMLMYGHYDILIDVIRQLKTED